MWEKHINYSRHIEFQIENYAERKFVSSPLSAEEKTVSPKKLERNEAKVVDRNVHKTMNKLQKPTNST